MFERFLTLGRHSIVYGLGGAALQVVGLLTVPIFTRVFDASQYGVLETTIAAYSALLVLADLGITASALRSYFDYDEAQQSERRSTLSTGLSASMLLALIWGSVAFAFASPIARWQFGTGHYAQLIRVAAIGVPVAVLCNFLREAIRLKVKPWAYTFSMTGGAIFGTGFALIDVLVFNAGIVSLLWGIVFGNAFSAVVSATVMGRSVTGRFSPPELRRMLVYGVPLIPSSIALWGVSFLDRSLLTKLGHGGPQARTAVTGEYALANRFSSVLMFCVTAFALAYVPFQFSLWNENPELEKQLRARVLTYLAVGLTGIAVVISLFAREVAELVSPSYPTAYEAVGMLTMSIAVYGVSTVALAGIALSRRTGSIATYTAVAVGLNAGLNLLLIPVWGMLGSAFATLAAYLLLTALYYRRSQVLYPTPFKLRRTVIVLAVGQLATLVGVIRFSELAVALVVKFATLVAFVAALRILRVLDEEDLGGVRALLRRGLGRTPTPGGAGGP